MPRQERFPSNDWSDHLASPRHRESGLVSAESNLDPTCPFFGGFVRAKRYENVEPLTATQCTAETGARAIRHSTQDKERHGLLRN